MTVKNMLAFGKDGRFGRSQPLECPPSFPRSWFMESGNSRLSTAMLAPNGPSKNSACHMESSKKAEISGEYVPTMFQQCSTRHIASYNQVVPTQPAANNCNC